MEPARPSTIAFSIPVAIWVVTDWFAHSEQGSFASRLGPLRVRPNGNACDTNPPARGDDLYLVKLGRIPATVKGITASSRAGNTIKPFTVRLTATPRDRMRPGLSTHRGLLGDPIPTGTSSRNSAG